MPARNELKMCFVQVGCSAGSVLTARCQALLHRFSYPACQGEGAINGLCRSAHVRHCEHHIIFEAVKSHAATNVDNSDDSAFPCSNQVFNASPLCADIAFAERALKLAS